ncbi:MAG: ribonuclease [archaeon]|nr:ribonuclease [archaeon]
MKLISIIIIIIAALGVCGFLGFNSSDSVDSGIQLTDSGAISEDGQYDSVEDVSAYLIKYHKLPSNYMTKSDAHAIGWQGGSLEKYAPGMCIGGDVFTNRQEILPTDKSYRECDIDTLGADGRGAKRLVYSTDYEYIYYTNNHYESFNKIR